MKNSDAGDRRGPRVLGREMDYVRILPRRARLMLLAAVFFLFAPMWLISVADFAARDSDGALLSVGGVVGLFVWAALGGLTAVLWVLGFSVSKKWLIAAIALNILMPIGGVVTAWAHDVHGFWLFPAVRSPIPGLEGALLVVSLVVGYFCFNAFVNTEGRRRVQLETEVSLAAEIHSALVPSISAHWRGWSVAGVSRASGSMGGDLIDLVLPRNGADAGRSDRTDDLASACTALILDVSGHGVKAGVVMALLKGAARTSAAHAAAAAGGAGAADGLADGLAGVSRVLYDATEPGLFATGTWLTLQAGGRVRYAVAGHPPGFIVRVAAEADRAERTLGGGLPMGVIADADYHENSAELSAGDALVLYTDGLTEARDVRTGEMLGLDGIEVLAQQAVAAGRGDADVIASELLGLVDARTGGATAHDDMSVLVVVRRAEADVDKKTSGD